MTGQDDDAWMGRVDQIIALSGPEADRIRLDRMAAYIRDHRPDAAAQADEWETPEGFLHHGVPGWLAYVAQEHPAAFDAALAAAS